MRQGAWAADTPPRPCRFWTAPPREVPSLPAGGRRAGEAIRISSGPFARAASPNGYDCIAVKVAIND